MSKVITLTVGSKEIRFNPDIAAYNKYLNEMMPNDKVAPATNYLRRIAHKDDKAYLDEVLHKPGAVMKLLMKVNEEYEEDLDIEVKN